MNLQIVDAASHHRDGSSSGLIPVGIRTLRPNLGSTGICNHAVRETPTPTRWAWKVSSRLARKDTVQTDQTVGEQGSSTGKLPSCFPSGFPSGFPNDEQLQGSRAITRYITKPIRAIIRRAALHTPRGSRRPSASDTSRLPWTMTRNSDVPCHHAKPSTNADQRRERSPLLR